MSTAQPVEMQRLSVADYGACGNGVSNKIQEVICVNFDSSDGIDCTIGESLEAIFSRASEGMPLFEKLGALDGIAKRLNTDLRSGVSSDSVERRREMFGKNVLPEDPPLTFWQIYVTAWGDNMIRLLTVAAIVSLVLGLTVPEPGETKVNYTNGWVEGFAILCSVLIVTTVSSVNDYLKEKKFNKLTEENAAQPIRVIRDGRATTIDVSEAVVGDLVYLSPGLVVPVDGFYVAGMGVEVDESSVTGENDPRVKNAEAPIILTGTVVNTSEDAYVLACAVGERSFGGKLLVESRQSSAGPQLTPLQQRLNEFAGYVGRVGVSVASLLFVILSIIEIVRLAKRSNYADPRHFLDYFLLCVTVVVVAVPEGLPLAVTIALAYSQSKMHSDNNQVRRLSACETMGNATQICSDKTGTLTQNNMSVVQGYVGMSYFSVQRPGDIPEPICLDLVPESARTLLAESISVNSSSERIAQHVGGEGGAEEPVCQWVAGKGNKTDNALLDFVDRMLMADGGAEPIRPHQRLRGRLQANGFIVFPFTSDRKRMSTVVRLADGSLLQHVKGGSDRILELCDRYVDETGAEAPLKEGARLQINEQVQRLADAANRTIGVAYSRLSDAAELPSKEPATGLVWLGLLGIQDPLRPEVPEAVRKCQMAGVTVRMCTGDNLDTAVAISRQCGIFNRARGDLAMSGKEFRELVYDTYGDEERMGKFWTVLDHMTVMARSQPLDKQLLVLMLMSRGDVVAVTGDGTNDAPALRLANVGFVMRSGTDIAVKSADIVLLDDNFLSVQRALVWGRCVNDNIRKFLQLQLTVNYVSVALTFIGSVVTAGRSFPLTTVQLLWLNLIMDTLAALALATEEPSEACLQRPPSNPKAPLVTRRMHLTILSVAIYQLVVCSISHFYFAKWFATGRPHTGHSHNSFVFNLFVLSTIVQIVNCRKLYDEVFIFEGLKRSKIFIYVICFCVGFQVLAVETFGEFMQI